MRNVMLLFILIISQIIPNIVDAKVSLKTFEKWQEDYAVVLAGQKEGEYINFCSGTITNKGIITAAHCCAVAFQQKVDIFYSKSGEAYSPISKYELDIHGNDVCLITPKYKEYSPIKIADMPRADIGSHILKKDYINISKISLIYNKVDMTKFEIQNVWFISVWDDRTNISLFRGTGLPGMSGSGILDMKGNLVAVLTNGIFTDRGIKTGNKYIDFIEGIFGAATIESTQWSPR